MPERIEIFPGVLRHAEQHQAVYTGPADALIAAGLIEHHQLPGQPGNARGMCTYGPTGDKVAKGLRTHREPGHKYVVAKKCAEGHVFEIRLNLSAERVEALAAQHVRDTTAWPFPVVVKDTLSIEVLDRQPEVLA